MSKYTTGELARLCGVSVRTVQYYDTRGILCPGALSEGGRRLYSEADLSKLRIICFLRELELPIESIRTLFAEERPEEVISMLFDEQERILKEELAEKQARVERIAEVKRSLRLVPDLSIEAIGDIAHIMENKAKLRRARVVVTAVGLLMDAIQVATLMLWILRGIWIPFAVGMAVVVALGVWVVRFYWRRTAYICPRCHTVFRPKLREILFARHTPNTRRLTCTSCGHFGFCIETYQKEDEPC